MTPLQPAVTFEELRELLRIGDDSTRAIMRRVGFKVSRKWRIDQKYAQLILRGVAIHTIEHDIERLRNGQPSQL